MKDWIMELCPEIAEWQAALIAEECEKRVKAAVLAQGDQVNTALLEACKAALSDDQPYIEKCRAAIAAAEGEDMSEARQEPVACMVNGKLLSYKDGKVPDNCNLYLHPAPEAKPVAWMYQNANTDSEYLVWKRSPGGRNWKPLYTHPAPVNTALQTITDFDQMREATEHLARRIKELEQALDVAMEALEKSMYPQKLQLDAVAMLKELK